MELEEFIKQSLVAIDKGVNAANEELKGSTKYSIKSDTDRRISFDVAVTTAAEAKGSIVVWWPGLGAKGSGATSDQQVSRLQFHVTPAREQFTVDE